MNVRKKILLGMIALCLGPLAQAKAKTAQLTIATKGNELAFDQQQLTVRAGQPVKLTFTNRADAGSDMQHVWVLVKPGASAEIANQAAQAGPEKNYVPDSDKVIAHTKLVKPGASDSVQFRAPTQPGDYPFLCTVPGHADFLKGTLIVKK